MTKTNDTQAKEKQMENKDMPDVIWVNNSGGTGNSGTWSKYETPHTCTGLRKKNVPSSRKIKHPRFKYIRADKLAKVREALVKMADQWTVEEIHKNERYKDCDFEDGYDKMVKKSREALAILDELGVK